MNKTIDNALTLGNKSELVNLLSSTFLSRSNKQEITNWGMPNYSNEVSIPSGTTTVPYDAVAYIICMPTANDQWLRARVNSKEVYYFSGGSGYWNSCGTQFMIPKNATVTIDGNAGSFRCSYCPCIGG